MTGNGIIENGAAFILLATAPGAFDKRQVPLFGTLVACAGCHAAGHKGPQGEAAIREPAKAGATLKPVSVGSRSDVQRPHRRMIEVATYD
jgi:hypothetical protein